MQGYVHTINRRRGLVAIATDSQGFTVVELLGSDILNIGDRLEWDDARLGRRTYQNITKGRAVTVSVQAHGVPQDRVRQKLGL